MMANLHLAFPDKTEKELTRVSKDFYHHLCDTFLETAKMISISEKEIKKRMVVTGVDKLKPIFESGQSIQFISGHFMNWEYGNHLITLNIPMPSLGVYLEQSNKAVDKIMFDMRSRFGTILISAGKFRREFLKYASSQYALLLAADQKPGSVGTSYWLNYFGKPAPFAKGPEKGAKMNNTAIVFCDYYHLKRGYYQMDFHVVTTTPNDWTEGELTVKFRDMLEEAIRKRPANYLWTHKRWKHEWKNEYKALWVDKTAAPNTEG